MKITLLRLALVLVMIPVFWACEKNTSSDEEDTGPREVITEIRAILNPSGNAPLSAVLVLNTSEFVNVSIRVVGRNGALSDVNHDFAQFNNSFLLPILGLYESFENQVMVTIYDSNGAQIDEEEVLIQTDAINPNLPVVEINVPASAAIKPGFNLVNYFGHNGVPIPQRSFMFDRFGDIRWYLDFEGHPELGNLFSDNGITPLRNGNLVLGNGNTGAVYEINRLGEIIRTFSLGGFGFHHHVMEKPNGNLLVTVNDNSIPTVEDLVIEIDRSSGEIINQWDLNASLDNSRRAWPTDRANINVDWFHGNGIEYSPDDDAIIVSGRTQGVVKLTRDNEPVWILAPHRAWNFSGDGLPLKQFLLQPLDAQGNPITDSLVLDGTKNHPDFEWAWYQHSPILLPNGNLMVFDNGDNRNYTQLESYSRAVEYKIDEANMTIQQVFTYGKERGGAAFSPIVSKVLYFEKENTVLFTPGAIAPGGGSNGKVIEVDRQSGNVLFEATVTPPSAFFGITFHNVLRDNIYGEE